MPQVRVILPYHLRNLARVTGEVVVEVGEDVTVDSVLTSIEEAYPNLSGTIRDHVTKIRRPFVRFFACGEDISNEPTDLQLPLGIQDGSAPFMVVGAIAGG